MAARCASARRATTARTTASRATIARRPDTNLLAAGHPDREPEGRAVTQLALDPDLAAVQLDELPAEGQAEPGALDLLLRRPHLPELLEHRLLILRCYADPSVADRHLHEAILRHCRDLDLPALRRELDGVG